MNNSLNLCVTIVFLVVLGCSCPRLSDLGRKNETPTPYSTPKAGPAAPIPQGGEYDLTLEKYNKIRVGMAKAAVENTLGGKGTEISSSVAGRTNFSVNKWEGDGFKSIILSFKNDKVMSKSQVGLK